MPNMTTRTVEAMERHLSLFQSRDEMLYVRFPCESRTQITKLQGSTFRAFVQNFYYNMNNDIPPKSSTEAIVDWFKGKCLTSPKLNPSVRVKQYKKNTWLNMCDNKWRYIKVSCDGWSLEDECPKQVPLVREMSVSSYPDPVKGGNLELLKKHINYGDEDQWKLLVGFMLSVLRDEKEYPILVISGQQGSGKTTLSDILMTLLDPHDDTPASLPKKESDIGTTARHRHLLAFDNISGLKWDISDSLCKLSTGLSVSQRSLYTNGELYQYTVTRPVILNGIPNLVNRDDMARRVISLHLDKIPDDKNGKGISEVKKNFAEDNAEILGGLLDALVVCHRNIDTIKIGETKGFNQGTKWVEAAAEHLGWEPGEFTRIYNENRIAGTGYLVETNYLARTIMKTLAHLKDKGQPTFFEGTYEQMIQWFCLPSADQFNVDQAVKEKRLPTSYNWRSELLRIRDGLEPLGVKIYGVDKSEIRQWRTTDAARLAKVGIHLHNVIDETAS